VSNPMPGRPIDRRRFLVVAGLAIGGVAAAGARWLLGADPAVTAASPSSTTTPPTTTTPATTAATTSPLPATTEAPTTTMPLETTATTSATTTSTTAVPGAAAVEVICKQAWGANPVAGEFTSHTIENITVHHTAVVLSTNAAAPARARQHQSYHQELGWPDLAYHYLIDANGHVYEGRPVAAVGDTATDYDPTGHFLVCCEGDFNKQELPAAQYEALIRMLAWGVNEFRIEPTSIQGHREVASTSCPGDNLHQRISDGTIAADVALLVAAAVPMLEVVCGPSGAEVVAAIEAGEL
jgi:hypothetical protein